MEGNILEKLTESLILGDGGDMGDFEDEDGNVEHWSIST